MKHDYLLCMYLFLSFVHTVGKLHLVDHVVKYNFEVPVLVLVPEYSHFEKEEFSREFCPTLLPLSSISEGNIAVSFADHIYRLCFMYRLCLNILHLYMLFLYQT